MDQNAGKKRKTLDEYIGVTSKNTTIILVIAVLTSIFNGGILGIVSPVCAIYGGYYIFKQRNDPSIPRNTKLIRAALFIVWLFAFGLMNQYKGS